MFGQRIEYDGSSALPATIVNLGLDGEPAPSRSGITSVALSRGPFGDPMEWAYFGADGQPALQRNGYHKITLDRDDRGNVTGWAYFGPDGEPTLHVDGYHRGAQESDDRGNVTEWAHFRPRRRADATQGRLLQCQAGIRRPRQRD